MSDLDSILNGEVEEADEVTEASQAEPEEEPQQEEPEAEPEGVKEEEGESPAPEVEERTVPQKAYLEERRRRQEAEDKLNSKKKKAPDVFEDQEGYTQHVNQQINQTVLNERLNMSEFMARREFPDLDVKVEKFNELVASNPNLQAQVFNAVSPYHELVDVVNKAAELEQLKDVDSYKANLRAELEAEIRAEMKAEAKKSEDLRDSIPPSLNDVGTKGGLKGHNYSGPTSLDSILD